MASPSYLSATSWMRRRDDLLERDDLLALGVGKDERGVEVRLLDRFVAHLQAVDELDVDELLHLAEYHADLLLVDALGEFGWSRSRWTRCSR